jgi:hypothetical protein
MSAEGSLSLVSNNWVESFAKMHPDQISIANLHASGEARNGALPSALAQRGFARLSSAKEAGQGQDL